MAKLTLEYVRNGSGKWVWRAGVLADAAITGVLIDATERDAALAAGLKKLDEVMDAENDELLKERHRRQDEWDRAEDAADAAEGAGERGRILQGPTGAQGAGPAAPPAGPAAARGPVGPDAPGRPPSGSEPAGGPDRDPELESRQREAVAAARALELNELQVGALVGLAQGEIIALQTIGQPLKCGHFAVGILSVERIPTPADLSSPFWRATVRLLRDNDKPVKLGGKKKSHVKNLARAAAVSMAMLSGVGDWEDHVYVSEDSTVFHRLRAVHPDELRRIKDLLPAERLSTLDDIVDTSEWRKERATNYRTNLIKAQPGDIS